jgi:hypothetical protein
MERVLFDTALFWPSRFEDKNNYICIENAQNGESQERTYHLREFQCDTHELLGIYTFTVVWEFDHVDGYDGLKIFPLSNNVVCIRKNREFVLVNFHLKTFRLFGIMPGNYLKMSRECVKEMYENMVWKKHIFPSTRSDLKMYINKFSDKECVLAQLQMRAVGIEKE